MKKVLVINANPKSDSLCKNLAEHYARSASEKHEIEQINIGEMDFEMSLEHGYDKTVLLEPDLLRFQELIRWSEHIVIISPVWWGTVPAKFKGIIDRSFLPNFAFKYVEGKTQPEKLLKGRTSELIITLDSPPFWYKYVKGNVIHKQLKNAILDFSGIKNRSATYLGPVIHSNSTQRAAWLTKVSRLAKKISSYTMNILNDYEKENLYYLIYSSRFSESCNRNKFDSSNEEVECVNFTDFLIVNMVDECSAKFFDNSELRRNLMPHVRLLIMRLKHHINIHNPLLNEIRNECAFLFNSLTKIIKNSITFNKYNDISYDEIGYLTLYFQYYYEQHLQSLNVVIVCSTGIGTSHLLKGRVLKSFPRWKVIDIIPFSKIKKIQDIESVDLILTTINIDSFDYQVPYVHVSAFINEKDIDNILKITKTLEVDEHPVS